MKAFNKSISLFLVISLLLTINPLKSSAKWHDESGNLPGTVSDGTILALAGVAVVGIGVLTYVLIKKHKNNKTANSTIEYLNQKRASKYEDLLHNLGRENLSSKTSLSINTESTLMENIEHTAKTMPVDVIVTPLNSYNNLCLGATSGVRIGIRVRF